MKLLYEVIIQSIRLLYADKTAKIAFNVKASNLGILIFLFLFGFYVDIYNILLWNMFGQEAVSNGWTEVGIYSDIFMEDVSE